MINKEIVQTLRSLVEELEPFTRAPAQPGTLRWDGEKYAPASGPDAPFDPLALGWWMSLSAMAALLESQEEPLTHGQMVFLMKALFGGMGSLADFSLNGQSDPARTCVANTELRKGCARLYRLLKAAMEHEEGLRPRKIKQVRRRAPETKA
jgi:hypothetical protein